MKKITIALAQLICDDGRIKDNLEKLDKVIDEFGGTHDLLVFPETYTMGFPTRDICRSLAQSLDGSVVKHLEQKAKKAGTTIAAGLYERDGEEVFNTTVVVGPSGLLLSYRKTHLWVGEGEKVEAGDEFKNCSWHDTKLGTLICYDIEFPETARAVAHLGTELLVLTNGNMDPYGPVHRTAIQARAQENQIFVAMANRVGYGEDGHCYVGGSMVVNPNGQIIAEASNDKEEVLSVEIDLSLVQQSRQFYHYLNERRVQLFNLNETEKGTYQLEK